MEINTDVLVRVHFHFYRVPFFNGVDKVFDISFVGVLDAKIVDDKGEGDITSLVTKKVRE